MTFDVTGPGPVLLSFPAWTPGAYELSCFARWVSNFAPAAADGPGRSPGTSWTTTPGGCNPAGAKSVSVRFDYLADTLDNAMAWSRPDFVLFNGTNLLPYPEGRGTDFPATVTVKTEPAGSSPPACSRSAAAAPTGRATTTTWWTSRSSSAASTTTAPRSPACGPASPPIPPARSRARRAGSVWDQIGKMIPAESAVFQETPWQHYTVMMIFDSAYGGGSALEHTNSHVGIYTPAFIGNPDPRVDHRPRDLPRLERQAAAARGHGAVPLRSAASRRPGSG